MFDSNLCFAFLCIFQSARLVRPVVKAFVSIVQNLSKTCMFMGVFRFVNKHKLLIKGRIRCISKAFPGFWIVCTGPNFSKGRDMHPSAALAVIVQI